MHSTQQLSEAASKIDWGPLGTPTRREVPAGSLQWKDNAYVGFFDPEANIWGLFHWSASPNADPATIYGQLSVLVDGRTIDVYEPLTLGQDGFDSETIHFGLGDYVGIDHDEVKIDFTIRPRFHIADYTGGGVVPSLDEAALNHYHQSLFVTGTVTVDGKTTDFDGLGWRDRTWGFREEALHLTEYLAALVCWPEFDISVFKFRQPDGSVRTDGFVLRENDYDSIVDVAITRDFRGLTSSFTVTLEDGRTVTVDRPGDIKAHHYCPMGAQRASRPGPSFTVLEEFAVYETPGQPVGHGLVEHGILRGLY